MMVRTVVNVLNLASSQWIYQVYLKLPDLSVRYNCVSISFSSCISLLLILSVAFSPFPSFVFLFLYYSTLRSLFSLSLTISPFLKLCFYISLSLCLLSSYIYFFDILSIFNHVSGKGKGIGRFNGFGNSVAGLPDEKSGKRPPNGHQGKPSPSDADTTVQTDFTVIRVMSSQGWNNEMYQYRLIYCVSEKSCQFIYNHKLYKTGQNFTHSIKISISWGAHKIFLICITRGWELINMFFKSKLAKHYKCTKKINLYVQNVSVFF